MAGIKYKDGNGVWRLIKTVLVNAVKVVQTTGNSTEDVMSQKAVTDELSAITNDISTIKGEISSLSSHTHASSAITAMTGYVIASSGSSITTSDTLNQAIGKLEKLIVDLDGRLTIAENIINNS